MPIGLIVHHCRSELVGGFGCFLQNAHGVQRFVDPDRFGTGPEQTQPFQIVLMDSVVFHLISFQKALAEQDPGAGHDVLLQKLPIRHLFRYMKDQIQFPVFFPDKVVGRIHDIRILAADLRHLFRELLFLPQIVAVQKSDPVSACMAYAVVAAERYAGVHRIAQDRDARILPLQAMQAIRRSVGGAIVHDKDLKMRIGLREHRADSRFDRSFAVVRRYDDAHTYSFFVLHITMPLLLRPQSCSSGYRPVGCGFRRRAGPRGRSSGSDRRRCAATDFLCNPDRKRSFLPVTGNNRR